MLYRPTTEANLEELPTRNHAVLPGCKGNEALLKRYRLGSAPHRVVNVKRSHHEPQRAAHRRLDQCRFVTNAKRCCGESD
jgi:hypothetical protein